MPLDAALQLGTLLTMLGGLALWLIGRGGDEATIKSRITAIEAVNLASLNELKELRGISTDLLRTVAVGAETFNGIRSSISETKERLEDIETRLRAVETHRERMLKS